MGVGGRRPARRPRRAGERSEGHERRGFVEVASRAAQHEDRVEDLVQRVRVDRQPLGPAAEVGQRVVDDGTSTAQTAQRSWVTTRSASARRGRRPRGGRGPRRATSRRRRTRRSRPAEAIRHRRGRHDAPRARASVGKSHSKVTPTTSSPAPIAEQDLGRGGQGDDPHAPTVGRGARVVCLSPRFRAIARSQGTRPGRREGRQGAVVTARSVRSIDFPGSTGPSVHRHRHGVDDELACRTNSG